MFKKISSGKVAAVIFDEETKVGISVVTAHAGDPVNADAVATRLMHCWKACEGVKDPEQMGKKLKAAQSFVDLFNKLESIGQVVQGKGVGHLSAQAVEAAGSILGDIVPQPVVTGAEIGTQPSKVVASDNNKSEVSALPEQVLELLKAKAPSKGKLTKMPLSSEMIAASGDEANVKVETKGAGANEKLHDKKAGLANAPGPKGDWLDGLHGKSEQAEST